MAVNILSSGCIGSIQLTLFPPPPAADPTLQPPPFFLPVYYPYSIPIHYVRTQFNFLEREKEKIKKRRKSRRSFLA